MGKISPVKYKITYHMAVSQHSVSMYTQGISSAFINTQGNGSIFHCIKKCGSLSSDSIARRSSKTHSTSYSRRNCIKYTNCLYAISRWVRCSSWDNCLLMHTSINTLLSITCYPAKDLPHIWPLSVMHRHQARKYTNCSAKYTVTSW